MDKNDFIGSFAQENVSFKVQFVQLRSNNLGANFQTVMLFVESDRFVNVEDAGWEDAPGLETCKVLVVNADTYAAYTKGLLQSWLYDLFCNGFEGNAVLVAPAASAEEPAEGDEFQTAMETAFGVLSPYAYHKTVCAGGETAVLPAYAVSLAKLCQTDANDLSGSPLLPVTGTEPNLDTDPLYSALNAAGADAFMGWHSDATRNVALYSLGLAMAETNDSGTCVGNTLDMTSSNNITASNGGQNPTVQQKTVLKAAYVQYFKTVGDNTGAVAAETDKTILGQVYAAKWIVAYITYMTRVSIAVLLTKRNFFKNASNYDKITANLKFYVNLFGDAGVLSNVNFSYPEFANLPDSESDEIIIKNAWSAYYVDHIRKVQITGNLYIGA